MEFPPSPPIGRSIILSSYLFSPSYVPSSSLNNSYERRKERKGREGNDSYERRKERNRISYAANYFNILGSKNSTPKCVIGQNEGPLPLGWPPSLRKGRPREGKGMPPFH